MSIFSGIELYVNCSEHQSNKKKVHVNWTDTLLTIKKEKILPLSSALDFAVNYVEDN